MFKRCSLFLVLLISSFSSYGQLLEWRVNAFGFVDNREYVKADLYSQSILGMRIAPEVGFLLDSMHRIRFGVNFLQEFGAKSFGAKANPIIYYNYEQHGISFYLGAFPRHQLIGNYPKAVLNDTLNYYRPNIEGLFFSYHKRAVRQEVWVDWTSRQTEIDREQFMVGLSGKVNAGIFFFSHYATMLHTANTLNGDYPVRDNASALLQVGTDLSGKWMLDSLTIAAGGLASLDRIRGTYGTRTPKGFIADIHAAYRSWFLHDTFYKGQAHDVLFGDRFYTKDTYNRLDLGWQPFRKGNITGYFMLSLHFSPGEISNQQQLTLRYNLGGDVKLKQ